MTADEIVYETLHAITGLPGVAWRWEGKQPSGDFFVFHRVPGAGYIFADDEGYYQNPRFVVELWSRDNDPRKEARFASAVRQLGTYAQENPRVEEGRFVHPFRFTLQRRADS